MEELQIVEYNNIRVLTTQQVAEAYQTSADTVTRNFNRNKDRYIKGKHYMALEGEEKNAFVDRGQIDRGLKNAKTLYLWTQKGCLLHAKSLNTDIAWEVYDRLVDNYFAPVKPLSQVDMMRIQLGMIDNHEDRITNLENNMTIDYGQQRVLEDTVNKTVINVLGGGDRKKGVCGVQQGFEALLQCERKEQRAEKEV